MPSRDPYRNENGILVNLLGIENDHVLLHDREYLITEAAARKLAKAPIAGDFDLAHLKAVHKELFGQVYGWAGKERGINFSKGDPSGQWNTHFADFHDFGMLAKAAQHDIKAMIELGKAGRLGRDDFAQRMTECFTKLNYMHPFPEGNGRSTRVFMKQFAAEAGYKLDFSKVANREWNDASAKVFSIGHRKAPFILRPPDQAPMLEIFKRISEPLPGRTLHLVSAQPEPQGGERSAADMMAFARGHIVENLIAVRLSPVTRDLLDEAVQTAAVWRGIVQEKTQGQPEEAQRAALARFDAQLGSPKFQESLTEAALDATAKTAQQDEG